MLVVKRVTPGDRGPDPVARPGRVLWDAPGIAVGLAVGLALGLTAGEHGARGPASERAATPAPPQEVAHVEGIGGVFLRAPDPDALRRWYRAALGFPERTEGSPSATSFNFRWHPSDRDGDALTVWSVFGPEARHLGPADRQCMVNYRVRDLDALLARFDSLGIMLERGPDAYENGRFAWLYDPAGNRVELWEPS